MGDVREEEEPLIKVTHPEVLCLGPARRSHHGCPRGHR